MSPEHQNYQRRSLRLAKYDYSQPGAYFVTISTLDKNCMFGNVIDGSVDFTPEGTMVDQAWLEIPKRFKNVQVDLYVTMPNHVHSVLVIAEQGGGRTATIYPSGDTSSKEACSAFMESGSRQAPVTLGQIVGFYKYRTTKLIGTLQKDPTLRIWQKNYYEHVIRNEADLQRIREYIANNPLQWELDEENPINARQAGREIVQ